MIYLSAALIYISAIAGATYLACNEHPWIAVLVLLCGCSISVTTKETKKKEHEHHD